MPTVYFEDLEVGSVHLGRECVCDKSEMLEFSRRNDPWPFHVDEAAAALSPYGGIVARGGYIVTLWYRSLVEIYNTPRATWAFLGGLEWKLRFRAPVRAGDSLRARVTVKDKRPWILRCWPLGQKAAPWVQKAGDRNEEREKYGECFLRAFINHESNAGMGR